MRDRPQLLTVDDDLGHVAQRGRRREHEPFGFGLDGVEGMGLVEHERADTETAQLAEVRAPSERRAEVGGKRSHVGPAGAIDSNRGLRVGAVDEVLDNQRIDPNRPRGPLYHLTGASELVQPASLDLDRRDHGRDLFDLTDERSCGVRNLIDRELHRRLFEHGTRRVERVGGDAEHDARAVRLAGFLQVPEQPRRAAEPDEQDARRVGIESSRVTDAALPVHLAQPRDDVV